MKAAERHLEWRHIRKLIDDGIPAIQRVSGTPEVLVFIDEGGARLGLRAPIDARTPIVPSPVAEIEISPTSYGAGHYVQVSTKASALFAEFYALLEDMADRMQVGGESPDLAIRSTLANWKALLRPTERMSEEQRLGLFGELLVLDRLLALEGPYAIRAWTGPLGEPHDFRVGDREFEVKTTLARKRSHLVSSIYQLVPSPNHELFVISLQMEPAGMEAGLSLPELVDRVRTKVALGSAERDVFEAAILTTWRYSDVHGLAYVDRYQRRESASLVLVNDELARVVPSTLAAIHDHERISDVQYRLDLSGLGLLDGSSGFIAILPGEMAV
jgi:hypothetical protein